MAPEIATWSMLKGNDLKNFRDTQYVRQDERCPICTYRCKPCLDHDHGLDLTRGALCSPHNLGIGHFRTSAELRRAADYLDEWARKHIAYLEGLRTAPQLVR